MNKIKKRAQGISINTIIIAAIALIVLVVLVAIFTGRLGLFSKGIGEVNTCKSLGGQCLANPCEGAGDLTQRVYGVSDCGKDLSQSGGIDNSRNQYCCKRPE